jgi:hypothetical protein
MQHFIHPHLTKTVPHNQDFINETEDERKCYTRKANVCNGIYSRGLIVWVRPISSVYGLAELNYMLHDAMVCGQIYVMKRVHS